MTLRDGIKRTIRREAMHATVCVGVTGVWGGCLATGVLPTHSRLGVVIGAAWWLTYTALTLNRLVRAVRALRLYDSHPLAAYLAEIRHEFGDEQ